MKTNIGGLVGNMNGGKIVNSHAEGTIFINGSATNVGGLVGSMDGGEIENSTGNMRIISTEDNVFNDLRIALEQIDKSDAKQNLIQLVNDMENSVGEITFTDKYRNFMSNVADHITVVTPFLTKLAEFLM
ncbi:GLUG motif-containing protein [Lysinibacillus fusiformis]|uniref:GLUG motif-containing protein n=1 Tax=Lysinibacillus fusiformis TaxID=28031 RepID=UPI0004682031|nr:GLUG motif-containing protein [Lysinibacillus fusiformis]